MLQFASNRKQVKKLATSWVKKNKEHNQANQKKLEKNIASLFENNDLRVFNNAATEFKNKKSLEDKKKLFWTWKR